MSRPGTLREAVRFHRSNGIAFRYALAGFLDDFYLDRDSNSRRRRVEDEPEPTGDPQFDSLVAAMAEHLCNRWLLGPAPAWTEQPSRFLKRPMFLGDQEFKPFHLAESPAAYRRRFIFTEFEPLRRASMPKDAIWWQGEALRNGMTPLPGEIETPFKTPISSTSVVESA